MSKKNLAIIVSGILFFVFIMFLVIACANVHIKNVQKQEELKTNFSGVICEVDGEENVNYDIATLTNEIQFDNNIQFKNYKIIKINHSLDFKSLGVAFELKTKENANITLSLKKNNIVLKTCNLELEANQIKGINLVLENSVEVKATDEFSISVDSETDFVFDTLLFFVDEV